LTRITNQSIWEIEIDELRADPGLPEIGFLFRGSQKPGAELRARLCCDLFGRGEDDGACAGAFELCLTFITAVFVSALYFQWAVAGSSTRGFKRRCAELRARLYCEWFGRGEDDGACAGAFELCLAFITAVICLRTVFSMGGGRIVKPGASSGVARDRASDERGFLYFSCFIRNACVGVHWSAPLR
jgi:hypothetical protein